MGGILQSFSLICYVPMYKLSQKYVYNKMLHIARTLIDLNSMRDESTKHEAGG